MSPAAANARRAEASVSPAASAGATDVRRLVGTAAVYAVAALAQRALGFILLPVYTRVIPPSDYGALEVLTVSGSLASGILTLGLASAINKCFHRDCETAADRAAVLPTALAIDLPILAVGGVAMLFWAEPASAWLIGSPDAAPLLRLAVLGMLAFSVLSLTLAVLRAEERASAFGVLSLAQFAVAAALNILFVVGWGMGVRGVLLGTLIASTLSVPIALAVALRGRAVRVAGHLARPLVAFGVYLVPVMLASWAIDVSDRYFLRLYHGLDAVAVYGVGYKIGMVMELLVVWPFQLAWPAYSFAIASREGHEVTYARTLTYLALALVTLVVILSVSARVIMPVLVGPGYVDAYRVVPLIALAYALNGVHYCVSPGVHLGNRTRYLAFLAGGAALANVGLNVLVVPRWGMLGAAATTVVAFAVLALGTAWIAQRVHPVPYEYDRLGRIVLVGAAAWVVGMVWTAEGLAAGGLQLVATLAVFPLGLWLTGFVRDDEREALRVLVARRTAGALATRSARRP
jgi:O-antigen/teichoic acid export membrane protein